MDLPYKNEICVWGSVRTKFRSLAQAQVDLGEIWVDVITFKAKRARLTKQKSVRGPSQCRTYRRTEAIEGAEHRPEIQKNNTANNYEVIRLKIANRSDEIKKKTTRTVCSSLTYTD